MRRFTPRKVPEAVGGQRLLANSKKKRSLPHLPLSIGLAHRQRHDHDEVALPRHASTNGSTNSLLRGYEEQKEAHFCLRCGETRTSWDYTGAGGKIRVITKLDSCWLPRHSKKCRLHNGRILYKPRIPKKREPKTRVNFDLSLAST